MGIQPCHGTPLPWHWGLIILCCGVCPVHFSMFSSISGLYPQDAGGSPLSSVTTTTVSRCHQMSLEGKIAPDGELLCHEVSKAGKWVEGIAKEAEYIRSRKKTGLAGGQWAP